MIIIIIIIIIRFQYSVNPWSGLKATKSGLGLSTCGLGLAMHGFCQDLGLETDVLGLTCGLGLVTLGLVNNTGLMAYLPDGYSRNLGIYLRFVK